MWTFRTSKGGDPAANIIRLRASVEPTREDKLYAGERQKARILGRTSMGVDVDGNAFAPYSKKYAAKKRALGRPGVVDLRGRNAPHLLQSIVAKARSDDLVLGVYGDKARIGQIHNEGAGRLPKRRWFAASRSDLSAMIRDVGARIKARLKT